MSFAPYAAIPSPLDASARVPALEVLSAAFTYAGDSGAGMLRAKSSRVSSPETDPHHALAAAAACGDRKAAEALLRALLPRVRNLVRYFVRGDAEVDDIAQEAMVAVLRGLGGFRGEAAVTSWADRIVTRAVFAHLRRARVSQQRNVEYTPDLVPVSGDTSSAHAFLARRAAVRALDDVPSEQRHVIVLHHVLGLSVREISEELDVPFETVRSRLRLGIARLRGTLTEHDEPEAKSS